MSRDFFSLDADRMPPLHGRARSQLVDVPGREGFVSGPLIGPTRTPEEVRAEAAVLLLVESPLFPIEQVDEDGGMAKISATLLARTELRLARKAIQAEMATLEAWERFYGE